MKLDDVVLGVVIALFGATIITLASEFEALRHIDYGPGFFPTIIGACLVACGVLMVARRILASGLRGPYIQLGPWSRSPRHVVSFLLVPASVIVYILVSDAAGFFLTMIALLTLQIGWFTGRVWRSFGIAVLVTVFLQEFFQGFMSVPLPWGVLEPFSGFLTWM
ncbi:MAG: tripartite tricarboxylate transporter TctB family protein [Firmicutes bacterium]|nr:tripartite tricarboxylate transporter TctB family protein [Bacillota bacterium]